MSNKFQGYLQHLFFFILIGILIAIFFGLLILFSYIFLWGLLIGGVLWIIALIRNALAQRKGGKTKGRIIDHNENE